MMATVDKVKEKDSSTKHAGDPSVTAEIDAELHHRFEELKKFLKANQRRERVTNAGFESGRPALNMDASVKGTGKDIYNRPTIDQLARIVPRPISNNMATAEDMAKIASKLESMGVPTEHVQSVIIQAVNYCKDASSSAFMETNGTLEWSKDGAIMADSVIAIMRDNGTLRRVCRLYAPVTWNYMLVHDQPPADWAAMGFDYSNRMAAFDCFDYVENKSAVQPFEGLIRRPTPAEKIAHATYRRLALDRANRNETYTNYGTEITGGRLGPEIDRHFHEKGGK